MQSPMQHKAIVVTGAGGGIGAACAREFAAQGGSVIVADINGDGALAQARAIAEAGGVAHGMCVDVTSAADVEAMIGECVSRYGRIDVLHNNAAATKASIDDVDLITTDPAVWDTTFAVNLRGTMLGCKYALPHMIAQGGGVIINTSSGSGAIGEPTRFAYGASKAGINSLTRSIAARYGKQGVRCVAVSPGITLGQPSQDALAPTGWLAMMKRHHATPFVAFPEDVARVAVFLASDAARFVTGSVIPVDGGSASAAPFAADMRDNGYGIF